MNTYTFTIEQTPSYEKNAAHVGSFAPCVRCGRAIKVNGFMVHMTTSWEVVPVSAEVSEAQDQGWFPIGADCAKVLPFTHRMAL